MICRSETSSSPGAPPRHEGDVAVYGVVAQVFALKIPHDSQFEERVLHDRNSLGRGRRPKGHSTATLGWAGSVVHGPLAVTTSRHRTENSLRVRQIDRQIRRNNGPSKRGGIACSWLVGFGRKCVLGKQYGGQWRY